MNFLEKFLAKKRNSMVFLALLTFMVYMPVMHGDYVLDDYSYIVNNEYVHDLNHVQQIYTHTTQGASDASGNYYRPNQSLSHAFIYRFVGTGAPAQHIFSILIHVINVCLLFVFLGLLGFLNLPAFIAAAIFAVHPINTEAVAYISGLGDPLSMLFILSAGISYLYYKRESKIHYAVFTFGSVVLALFSKESSIMLMVLLLLIELYLQPSKVYIKKPEIFILGTVVFLCAVFAFLRSTDSTNLSSATNEYTQSLWIRGITFCAIFPRYMGMLIFPVSQYFDKPYSVYISLRALGFGGLMMLGAFAYLFYNSFKTTRILMLGIGSFFAFLLPVSGIIPNDAIYSEHWLYLPFIGVSIAIAMLLQNAKSKVKNTLVLLAGILIIGYSAKAGYRNAQWADPILFYKNEIKFNNKSARSYHNLALVFSEKKEYNSAAKYYSLAISIHDVYPQTHHLLAQTYLQLNQVNKAIVEEYKALQLQPNFKPSLNRLVEIYTTLKDEKRASAFSKLIELEQLGQMPDWNEIRAIQNNEKP